MHVSNVTRSQLYDFWKVQYVHDDKWHFLIQWGFAGKMRIAIFCRLYVLRHFFNHSTPAEPWIDLMGIWLKRNYSSALSKNYDQKCVNNVVAYTIANGPNEYTSLKFGFKYNSFNSGKLIWKYRLQTLVPASLGHVIPGNNFLSNKRYSTIYTNSDVSHWCVYLYIH